MEIAEKAGANMCRGYAICILRWRPVVVYLGLLSKDCNLRDSVAPKKLNSFFQDSFLLRERLDVSNVDAGVPLVQDTQGGAGPQSERGPLFPLSLRVKGGLSSSGPSAGSHRMRRAEQTQTRSATCQFPPLFKLIPFFFQSQGGLFPNVDSSAGLCRIRGVEQAQEEGVQIAKASAELFIEFLMRVYLRSHKDLRTDLRQWKVGYCFNHFSLVVEVEFAGC